MEETNSLRQDKALDLLKRRNPQLHPGTPEIYRSVNIALLKLMDRVRSHKGSMIYLNLFIIYTKHLLSYQKNPISIFIAVA